MSFTAKIVALSLDFLAQALQYTPTDEEFVSWVDSQPLPGRPILYHHGPCDCWQQGNLSLQAWVLESRGFSFANYLVTRLSEAEYLRWIDLFATTTLAPNG